jgi:hypothetical protein
VLRGYSDAPAHPCDGLNLAPLAPVIAHLLIVYYRNHSGSLKKKKHTDDRKIWLESSPEIDEATWTRIPGGGGAIEQAPGVEPPC